MGLSRGICHPQAVDDGDLPPLKTSLDLDTPSDDTQVGDSRRAVSWTDPDFDANQAAFYYLRVL